MYIIYIYIYKRSTTGGLQYKFGPQKKGGK